MHALLLDKQGMYVCRGGGRGGRGGENRIRDGRSKKIKNEIKYIYGVHPSPPPSSTKDVDRRYEVPT